MFKCVAMFSNLENRVLAIKLKLVLFRKRRLPQLNRHASLHVLYFVL